MAARSQAARVAVRVTPDALRQIRAGHPWVFDRSITAVTPSGQGSATAGDLAVVFDARRRFAAIGLFDPSSPVRVRVLHVGDPRPIDRAFWHDRLTEALARRKPLATDPSTTAYRLVHGENDRLPGLVVDRYGEVVVIKLYSLAWFVHLDEIVDVLSELIEPRSVVLRMARVVQRAADARRVDGEVIAGEPIDAAVPFLENGLAFTAEVTSGQKTGHFLDQRDNRRRVRDLSRGLDVLDVFCSTGGFSVYAAAGGARSVHSVDSSPYATKATRDHMSLHAQGHRWAGSHEVSTADAFAAMAEMADAGRRFGLVIVDPPSFASRADQLPQALAAYGRLTAAALALIQDGVLVQASCSSRVSSDGFVTVVHDTARRFGRSVQEIDRTAQPVDHPIGFTHGAYLKALFLRVT